MGCTSSTAAAPKPVTDLKKPLFVRVEKATGLRDDAVDAYVVVRMGHTGSSWASKFDDTAELQWTGKVKNDSGSPTWNLAFSFEGAVVEAALRTLSPDDDWELQARVYDSEIFADDFLGEATTAIPAGPEETSMVLPLTAASSPKGNVTVHFAFSAAPAWVTPELSSKAGVVNGTVAGGAAEGLMLSKLLNGASVDWESFMSRLAHAFGEGKDGPVTPQNLSYIADMVKFGLLSPSYSEVFYGRSEDGGETVKDFPGPCSTTVLSHAKIVEGLQSICAKLESNELTRTGPDGFLGLLRLNGAWWAQGDAAIEPPCITLAGSFEKHTWVRPIIEKYMGMGDSDEQKQAIIAQSARDWIDAKVAAGQPFRVRDDVNMWSIKILHILLLDISLSDAELEDYVSQQRKITLISSFVPAAATAIAAPLLGLPKALEFRRQYVDKYSAALKVRHSDLSPEDLKYLAASFLDAMLFAGGASVGLSISCALGAVYGDASPLARSAVPAVGAKDEQFAKQVTWESIRFFPPVVGFPWTTPGGASATNATATHRTTLALSAGMKDPRVWGEDAEQFKLRPLFEYHKLSVAFAELAVCPEGVKGGSRSCPGKNMALACITEFLKAWFATESKWVLPADQQANMVFTGSPTQKPGGFSFVLTTE